MTSPVTDSQRARNIREWDAYVLATPIEQRYKAKGYAPRNAPSDRDGECRICGCDHGSDDHESRLCRAEADGEVFCVVCGIEITFELVKRRQQFACEEHEE